MARKPSGAGAPGAPASETETRKRPAAAWIPVESIRPDPKNARERTPRNLAAIRASLEKFGQQKPIVVDADGIIRAGNGTWMVAKELGWREIWAHRSELRGDAAVAYAIADNRSNDLSLFDEGELAAQLGELPRDLALAAGFDDAELADLLPTLEEFDDGDAEGGGGSGRSAQMGDKDRAALRVLIGMSAVERLERALLLTGKANREAALMEIVDAYLEAQGQQHLHG